MTSYTSVFGNQAVPPAEQSYGSYSLTADTPFEWAELATGIYLIYELMDFALDAAWALTLPKASRWDAVHLYPNVPSPPRVRFVSLIPDSFKKAINSTSLIAASAMVRESSQILTCTE